MALTATEELRLFALECGSDVSENVNLAQYSQWKIGGRADILIRPGSTEEVSLLMAWLSDREIEPLVIGLTSNLLFSDRGVRVPIIVIGDRMSETRVSANRVVAQAGVWVPGFARKVMNAGLSGAEHICGIPGALGGLVCMNGGSQRKGIGSSIEWIESVDINGRLIRRNAEQCDFQYRSSVYRSKKEIITSAGMRFDFGNRSEIRRNMLDILRSRRKKFPRKLPNCGSVFKSNPNMYSFVGPPGLVIENLGFKGFSVGRALVSPMHANFIVNEGGAKAVDVQEIVKTIFDAVLEKTGFNLEAEVCYVSEHGVIAPII